MSFSAGSAPPVQPLLLTPAACAVAMPFNCLLLPAAAAALAQDASKARESRLRKAGLQGRARMASELRDMDNDIAALSKALAVSLSWCNWVPAFVSVQWGSFMPPF